ncbi:MAG: class I SAM-dependent methyltransferase [Halanaerobiales bacterium]
MMAVKKLHSDVDFDGKKYREGAELQRRVGNGILEFDNEFDIIFSNAALHWVHDHEKVLKNCYNALKPGGFL